MACNRTARMCGRPARHHFVNRLLTLELTPSASRDCWATSPGQLRPSTAPNPCRGAAALVAPPTVPFLNCPLSLELIPPTAGILGQPLQVSSACRPAAAWWHGLRYLFTTASTALELTLQWQVQLGNLSGSAAPFGRGRLTQGGCSLRYWCVFISAHGTCPLVDSAHALRHLPANVAGRAGRPTDVTLLRFTTRSSRRLPIPLPVFSLPFSVFYSLSPLYPSPSSTLRLLSTLLRLLPHRRSPTPLLDLIGQLHAFVACLLLHAFALLCHYLINYPASVFAGGLAGGGGAAAMAVPEQEAPDAEEADRGLGQRLSSVWPCLPAGQSVSCIRCSGGPVALRPWHVRRCPRSQPSYCQEYKMKVSTTSLTVMVPPRSIADFQARAKLGIEDFQRALQDAQRAQVCGRPALAPAACRAG